MFDQRTNHDQAESVDGEALSAARIQQAFEDCLLLRELAGRQTLRVQDNRDLDAIADRLHALAVSRTDTRYSDADRERELREQAERRLVGCAEIVNRLRSTGNPDDLADASWLLWTMDDVAEYVGVLRGVE